MNVKQDPWILQSFKSVFSKSKCLFQAITVEPFLKLRVRFMEMLVLYELSIIWKCPLGEVLLYFLSNKPIDL